MMKSPAMKCLGMVSWAVTALVSMNMGLMPMRYDVFSLPWVHANLGGLMGPIHYFVGLCGLMSFGMFVMALMYCHSCGCEAAKCSCGSGSKGGSKGGSGFSS